MADHPDVRGCVLPLHLHYSVTDHTWVHVQEDGTCRVGMTDVAQNLAGPLLHAKPKKVGASRKRGKPVSGSTAQLQSRLLKEVEAEEKKAAKKAKKAEEKAARKAAKKEEKRAAKAKAKAEEKGQASSS